MGMQTKQTSCTSQLVCLWVLSTGHQADEDNFAGTPPLPATYICSGMQYNFQKQVRAVNHRLPTTGR
jgi:hypothetical protein